MRCRQEVNSDGMSTYLSAPGVGAICCITIEKGEFSHYHRYTIRSDSRLSTGTVVVCGPEFCGSNKTYGRGGEVGSG